MSFLTHVNAITFGFHMLSISRDVSGHAKKEYRANGISAVETYRFIHTALIHSTFYLANSKLMFAFHVIRLEAGRVWSSLSLDSPACS